MQLQNKNWVMAASTLVAKSIMMLNLAPQSAPPYQRLSALGTEHSEEMAFRVSDTQATIS